MSQVVKNVLFGEKNAMDSAFITARGLKKSFLVEKQKTFVLLGIDVEFQSGKTYAITGVSGTGKSTLLHLLAGLDEPTSGKVFFNGQSIANFSFDEHKFFLQRSVGLVFQFPHLIKELSVLENVMLPSLVSGASRSEAEKKASVLLKDFGILGKQSSQPASLSGGQQQRASLARALINGPKFLLADEPTGNLDIETGKKMVELLLLCNRKWGMGIIVASHDSHVASSMQTVFVLQDGLLRPV